MEGAGPMFMDPYLEVWPQRNNPNGTMVDPFWETLRFALGDTRTYADKLDLRRAIPSAALSSTNHCLANPGSQYLVYQGGSGSFQLTVVAGTYRYEWYNVTTRVVAETGMITVPSIRRTFTPPFSGEAVLYLSTSAPAAVPSTTPVGAGMLAFILGCVGIVALARGGGRRCRSPLFVARGSSSRQ